MKKVLIAHRIISPYRVPFYRLLESSLKKKGVRITVVYGQPAKNDLYASTDLDIGIKVKARYIYWGRKFFVWLPILKYVRDADLVILRQANMNLVSHLLIPLRKWLGFKLAFWGHGRNFQAKNRNGFGEILKRFYSAHVDFWFAYTELSKRAVDDLGFPEKRIVSVNNAIDTAENIRFYNDISPSELKELRQRYRIPKHSPVGIFCGRLYQQKGLQFLLESIRRVKNEERDFHFFVIGAGPDSSILAKYAREHGAWFHYVGPKHGREKAKYFRLAQFQLMPRLVGLHIVDSFAMLTPLITTNTETHGPEVIYLENGVNGIMTRNCVRAYAQEILHVMRDRAYQDRLIEGCKQARREYTIENMVERFGEGVTRALAL